MLHVGTNGYWRDTMGSRTGKITVSFGHSSKVSRSQAMVLWRNWIKCHGDTKPNRQSSLSLSNVSQEYLNWAAVYYRHPDKTPTGEAANVKFGLQPLVDLMPYLSINQFSANSMDMFVESLIQKKLSRTTINKRIGIVKRFFKWAKNHMDCQVYDLIRDYSCLSPGRSKAKESDKIEPVSQELIDLALGLMTPSVADMVRIQLLTGMRPDEVCQMTTPMIDRSKTPWIYQPKKHKNQWRGMARIIRIGPKARKILQIYLDKRPFGGNLFRPGNDKKGSWSDHFTTNSYRQAIWRACKLAKIDNWSPNQLRHTRLTELERTHGANISRAVAGHSNVETTQGNYIARDSEIVAKVMEQTG